MANGLVCVSDVQVCLEGANLRLGVDSQLNRLGMLSSEHQEVIHWLVDVGVARAKLEQQVPLRRIRKHILRSCVLVDHCLQVLALVHTRMQGCHPDEPRVHKLARDVI